MNLTAGNFAFRARPRSDGGLLRRKFFSFLLLSALAASCHREERSQIERDQLRPASEWLKEEPVALLHKYVRIDTTESQGEEKGAEFLQRFLDCEGIETEVVCPAPRRCNLLARLPGRSREGALLLLNHIDVVDVYAQLWKEAPPFEGKIHLGYLYGRGTYDMKSIAIAQALAIVNLKRHGIVPASDVLFLAEAGEEHDQLWGSRWLLDHRPEWFRGVAAVLNEGAINEMILRDVRFWGLETLQSGIAVVELEAEQAASLERVAAEFARFRIRGPAVPPHPHVVIGFGLLANHLQSPLTDPVRHIDRTWQDPEQRAVLPDRYGAFVEPRATWWPVYLKPPGPAGKPHMLFVVAVPPGVDPSIYSEPVIRAASRLNVRVSGAFASEPAGASPYPTPFTELLRRVTEVHHPGIPFGPVPIWGAITTSAIFRHRGFAAYGYSPIPVNIIDESRRHGNDERIFLRDYVDGVRLYEDIVEEWAMNPPDDGRRGTSAASASH